MSPFFFLPVALVSSGIARFYTNEMLTSYNVPDLLIA